jgi:diadenylate cyclase
VLRDLWGILAGNILQITDTLLVAVLFYYLLVYVRGTKTAMLLRGLLIFAAVYFVCQQFKLVTLVFILEKLMVVGPLALIVIFAPEIRQLMEQAGSRSRLLSFFAPESERPRTESALREELSEAVHYLAEHRIGALIVIEREDDTSQHTVQGTALDAKLSDRLMVSIFERHNPLHDGAVLIRDERVHSAGNILPISENANLPGELGTRHRAAIGLSERCDALVVVVSEERGEASIVFNGRIARPLSPGQFTEQLAAILEVNESFASLVPRAVGL